MEALLCEQGGRPSLYAGRKGGPCQHNDRSRVYIFPDNWPNFKSRHKMNTKCIHQMNLPGPQQHLLVQPRVVTRHFVSAAETQRFQTLLYCDAPTLFHWGVNWRHMVQRKRFHSAHLFQEVPGFLCEVRWKAEFAFQDFVNGLLSVLTSEWRL